jgi:predicted nucleotidyltransferase
MNKEKLNNLIKIFKSHKEIKLVYLFGSQATGKTGPLSDYDFAVYLDAKDTKEMFYLRLDLFYKVSTLLKTDKIDIVVINTAESPELKYNIISKGNLIFCIDPFKTLVEPKILNEYFDFHDILLRHRLTKAKI